ncbi:unnamed protein product [Colias eurytheme]|nr:unnamed protein product [Colias eurytheme]
MPRGGFEYSSSEIADIHFIYGFCNGSAHAAVQEYARRFPERRTPHRRTFINVHNRLAELGIRQPPVEVPARLRDDRLDKHEAVMNAIERAHA